MRHRILSLLSLLWLSLGMVASASPASLISQQSPQLPERPLRILSLEFPLTESLLALGIQPLGVVEPAGYQAWIGYGNLESVANLGSRQQPSLEQMALLQPDLILGIDYRHAPLFEALQRIAPTVLFHYEPGFSGQSQLDDSLHLFEQIARLTGRTPQAQQLLTQFETELAQHRQRLHQARLSQTSFLLLQDLGLANDTYWLYTGNSMAAGLAHRLNLRFWPETPSKDGVRYLYSQELLTEPAQYLLFSSLSGPDIGLDAKTASPVWQQIPAKQAGRVRLLERNIWSFGGPHSALRLARAITDALLAQQPATR